MRLTRRSRFAALALAALTGALAFSSFQASSEDIDIFTVDESNVVAKPNVLFVIDNSANWSRQSQGWPGGEVQGQSEADAIKTVIQEVDDDVNIGLMEYITGGAASDQDSAFIRFHIRPMTAANKATLAAHMTTIYNNINDPVEKRPRANPFGNLFWDVYDYLAGVDASQGGNGTPSARADSTAYQSLYGTFQSPLTSADTCTRTVVIFIGNNTSDGPASDSDANVAALRALAGGGTAGDRAVTQIPFADYAIVTTPTTANLGYTTTCYASAAACTTAVNNAACTDNGYLSCSCSSTDFTACPSTHWSVVGSNTSSVTTTVSGPTAVTSSDVETGKYPPQQCKTSGGAPSADNTCPADTTATTTSGNQTTTTVTHYASCSWHDETATLRPALATLYPSYTSCSPTSKHYYFHEGTKTVTTTVRQTDSVTTATALGDSSSCFNDSITCKNSGAGFAGYSCGTYTSGGTFTGGGSYNNGCTCAAATGTSGCGAGNTSKFQTLGTYNVTSAQQLGTYHAAPQKAGHDFMMDEWARYLRQTGVPIPGGSGVRSQVTTYTVDVFHDQQDADFSALLFNAARVGGGKYFQARDKNALINALRQILTEVQAVNSAFSSASLPVNATNRAQNENQVFIGVFKPDRTKRPLWFGNLKRYQLITSGGSIDLGDSTGARAINTNTGFITDCAVSYWTVDSTFNSIPYWQNPSTTDPIPLGGCTTNTTSDLSDNPDGPFVEKGAVAEVIRRGNDPSATPDSDGNFALNRTVLTRTAATTPGSVLPAFNATNAPTVASATTLPFIRGEDVKDEDADANGTLVPRALTEPRSTIHGDVVHSRPQPLNFGGSTGVVVFYGSNDGHFRAVKASTGQELWSFIAPEHYSKLDRLYNNSPNIRYFGDSTAGLIAKDYFFDGSTGVYQTFNADNTANKTWIYPSMHRGGYKVYALDVSTPTTPKYLWSKGCLNDLSSCDTGFSAIGQTWSLPNVALIKGYSTTAPVVVFGGGYDTCDDDNSRTPCAASRGRGVYVVDAETGTLLKYFDFSGVAGARGISADVALIDIDNDKMVDYGYAVDTGGNIYRMDFIDGPTTKNALVNTAWVGSRVAYTAEAANPRKFVFTPALLQATSNVIYLAIGSGDREHPLMSQYPYGTDGSPSTAILNRFYVFKDNLADVDTSTATNLDSTTEMADYSSSNNCSATSITPSSTLKGWYINLNAQGQGEQTVTSAVIAAGFVFFSTNRPTPPSTTACSTSLGEARGYFLNLLNGSGAINVAGACGGNRSSTFVGGGLPPSPVLATVPIGGEIRTVVIGAVQKTGEPSSPIEAQRVRPPIASDRKPIYWFKSTGDK